MKRIFCFFALLFAALAAGAQTRTYTDNASGAFVIGLDDYFYGASGSLNFEADGKDIHAALEENGSVIVNGIVLSKADLGQWDTIIGTHDFTNNRVPELVVAKRRDDVQMLSIYTLEKGQWKQLGGTISCRGGKEFRIFRQVISIRRGEVLCSWTVHNGRLDYKASDGSAEPTL